MKKQPDYGFENGLRIKARDFAHQKEADYDITISQDQLRSLAKPNEKQAADVAEAMANPRLVRGLGGVALEVAVTGPRDAEEVISVSYGWGGNVRHPVAVYEAQVLTANNPDSQLVFMNNFGTDNSSLLPKAVSKEIRQTGSYLAAGEYIASVIDQVADGRPTHLRGHSLGGRTAVGVAPYLERPADTMVLNDPTGTRKMNLAQIAINFALREGKHLNGYVEAGFDPRMSDLQRNPVKASVWDTAKGNKGGWKQQFLVDPYGLSLDAFEGDLRAAAPSVNSLIRVVSPELSELNEPQTVAEILDRLRDVEGVKADVQQFILRNHTHSAVTVPQVLAAVYKTDIDQPQYREANEN